MRRSSNVEELEMDDAENVVVGLIKNSAMVSSSQIIPHAC